MLAEELQLLGICWNDVIVFVNIFIYADHVQVLGIFSDVVKEMG